ncbi:hypothetical protein [Pseudomonas sp. GOM6]|uniref:hypothetical protein n=1 Tax=Pseudomonas sp. GOM6 TaxID=3036944 RepID=UPI0024097716|nr:hypothetical protein [Pseudomonas sp. GOM6]MDG1579692.1 hypothetical protein [Pseudomonas sp. GOM6]
MAALLFVGIHDWAVAIAADHGRSLRGGVGWGITVELAFYSFVLLLMAQAVAALRWPARRIWVAASAWLVFMVLMVLMANPFAAWSHPYRFILLLVCAALGFATVLAGQVLWQNRLVSPRV